MADLLDSLATAGKTALQVPQAVGGGALDILIGNRTNVPAGEQVKRGIEALLFAGDNPANLIAMHRMNAARDEESAQIVNTPEFRRTMGIMQTSKALTPEQAYDQTAKLYGVTGYRPPMEAEAIDAPLNATDRAAGLGAPSLPEQQMVPQLPPVSSTAMAKNLVARTQYDAMTKGSDLDQLLARYQASGMSPPIGVQRGAAEEALRGYDQGPGISKQNVSWNGEKFTMEFKQLDPDEEFFAGDGAENRALDAAYYQNKFRESIGDSTRVGLIKSPSGAFTLKEMKDPASDAAAGVRGKAIGENTPIAGRGLDPSVAGKTPAQIEVDKASRLSEIKTGAAGDAARNKLERQVKDDLAFNQAITSGLAPFINDKALPARDYFTPDAGGVAGDLGNQATQYLKSFAPNAFPDAAKLEQQGEGLLGQIARRYAGEKGVLTEKDVERIRAIIPNRYDTQAMARDKLTRINTQVADIAQRRLEANWQPDSRRVGANLKPLEDAAPMRAPVAASTGDPDLDAVLRRGR